MVFDPASVLLGGAVTLAVTSAVQILVVPRVQARTRRRERWEKNVIELVGMLEEELPRTLQNVWLAGHSLRLVKERESTEGINLQRLNEYRANAEKERLQARQLTGE